MNERKMRRSRQQLDQQAAIEILLGGKTGVMAVVDDDNFPYAVPVNYVYSDGYIYIHSAAQGHKIDALKHNPRCSFCVIESDEIVAEEFTAYFRSAIAFGTVQFITTEDEKIAILRKLCDKYSPGLDSSTEIGKCLKAVTIIAIRIEQLTGKEAIELVRRRTK